MHKSGGCCGCCEADVRGEDGYDPVAVTVVVDRKEADIWLG